MKTKLRICLILISLPMLVLLAVGCGNSPAALCSRMYNAINAKVSDCGNAPAAEERTKCETSISNCNADDLAKINTAVTCVEGMSVCVKSSSFVFLGEFLKCLQSVNSVSATCKSAVSFDLK